ncbi:MAG TPA: hypothetical protein VH762_03890 [Gemmatimonadaceae bacterium]
MARTVDRIGLSNESLRTATSTIESFPSLTEDLTTDVCVIGAGIAGMSELHGRDVTRLIARAHMAAIDRGTQKTLTIMSGCST